MGTLKILMYATLIQDIQMLQEHVFNTCQHIRNQPGMFERLCGFLRRRAEGMCYDEWKSHRASAMNKQQGADDSTGNCNSKYQMVLNIQVKEICPPLLLMSHCQTRGLCCVSSQLLNTLL